MKAFAFAVLLVSATALAKQHLAYDKHLGLIVDNGKAGEDAGPRFAFTEKATYVSAKTTGAAAGELGIQEWATAREVVAKSSDNNVKWVSADLIPFEIGCGAAPCPPEPPPGPAEWHATALFDGEQVVVWHIAEVVTGKAQAAAIKKGTTPPAIAKKIDGGAEDLVKLFETSIADPKTLAATVSDRKDVVLYGNEAKERTVGGAKVKAKLVAWKLGFRVRDGIQAGVTSSKMVGWVAANLDARSATKPKDTPIPYRVLFVYEKKGSDWKLVNAHFSFVD